MIWDPIPIVSLHIVAETMTQLQTEAVHHSAVAPSDSESGQQNDVAAADVSDDSFEFSFVSRHSDVSSPVSADDIFLNGQIRPIYPHASVVASIPIETAPHVPLPRRLPLRTLMFEERETANIDFSAAEGTYCVWTPPCKKTTSSSSSTKRWKIRNLLLRSHGDKMTSKVAPKHSSAVNGCAAAKLVGFFTHANGLARNFQLSR